MPLYTNYAAKCDKCNRIMTSLPHQTMQSFRTHLRENKWWAGKKKVLCPDHRPVVKDPQGAADRWAAGLAEFTGLPLDMIKEGTFYQNYHESLKA